MWITKKASTRINHALTSGNLALFLHSTAKHGDCMAVKTVRFYGKENHDPLKTRQGFKPHIEKDEMMGAVEVWQKPNKEQSSPLPPLVRVQSRPLVKPGIDKTGIASAPTLRGMKGRQRVATVILDRR